MKRLLSLLLCIVMVLSTMLLLTSCWQDLLGLDPDPAPDSGDTTPPEDEPPQPNTIDLSEYELVYGKEIEADAWLLNSLTEVIEDKFGVTLTKVKDRYAEIKDLPTKEILIGYTARTETKAVRDQFTDEGYFGVSITENKIVICGANIHMTELAVEYFITNYLAPSTSTTSVLAIEQGTVVTSNGVVLIAKQGSIQFDIIYDDVLDTDPKNCPEAHGPSNLSTNPDQVDYAVHLSRRLAERLGTDCGINKNWFTIRDDSTQPKGKELYVGYVNRDDAQENLARLDVNQYGVFTTERRVMILAWNDTMLEKAYDYFFKLLDQYARTENGKKVYSLPAYLAAVRTEKTDWVIDFPKPEADKLLLAETVDVYDSSVEYIYTGKGATAANFEAYCQALVEAGYKLNNKNTIEQSQFRTYVNSKKGVVLHVTYAAYAHASTYRNETCDHNTAPGGGGVYPEWPVSIRVVAAPTKAVTALPDTLLNKNQSFLKRTDTMLTSVNQNGKSAECYVMTLEDGSFVLFDSGSTSSITADQLYDVLLNLYKKTHNNKAPTTADPIVIAGWFISHTHGDHSGGFLPFAQKYGDSPLVKMEHCFANLASTSEQFNICGAPIVRSFKDVLGKFYNETTCIKMHSGYKFYLRNVEFEVLYTHEDMHPHMLDYFNETSTVVRATIRNSGGGNPITFLFTGDMNRYTGYNLCAMYGSYIKSEMMTMAHHGWAGPYEFFYDTVAPKILWWPINSGNYKNMAAGNAQSSAEGKWYQSYVDKYVANNLASIRYIFVADKQNQTLILKKAGINYTAILTDMFDAVTGGPISFKDNVTIMKK